MSAREELATVVAEDQACGSCSAERHHCEECLRTADAILAAGYRKLEPVWAEALDNDGEFEYTTTWHCDGTFAAKWKRKPRLQALEEYQPWQVSL